MRLAPQTRSLCDWPLIAGVMAMILAATVHAAPDVLLCRDGDRIVMLPAAVKEANFASLPPVCHLERFAGRSSIHVTAADDALTIAANLDFPGPAWLNVVLRSDECGVFLTSHDTGTNFDTFDQADALEGLGVDSRTLLGVILAHLGQCGLPELSILRAIAAPPSEATPAAARALLARLDSDVYLEREAASRELVSDPYTLRWLLDTQERRPRESPEAEARINVALAVYADATRWGRLVKP